jgi:ActR/RegA family two-component response regulator
VLNTARLESYEDTGSTSFADERPSSVPWNEALVADDDALWRQQLGELLGQGGGRVRVARDGEEWLAAIRERPFDLIIVEPNLPGRLWYSLMHDVRSHAPDARLIVTTAFPSRALVQVARSLNAEAVLPKPVRLEQIEQQLHAPGDPTGRLLREGASAPESRMRSLAWLEWEYINHVLRRCGGNVTEASRRLKVPRQTLYRKLRKHPPLS